MHDMSTNYGYKYSSNNYMLEMNGTIEHCTHRVNTTRLVNNVELYIFNT